VWLGRWNHDGERTRATFREVAVPGEEATSRAGGGSGSASDGAFRGSGGARAGGDQPAGRLPRESIVHAALRDGFVIEQRGGLALWDGDRARPLPGGRRAWPVASGGSAFAWCRDSCRSVRVRTAAGYGTLTLPPRLPPLLGSGGSFSPDGNLLALPVTRDGDSHAAIADLRTGEWSTVPGGRLATYGALAWSRSTDRLYLATAGGGVRSWEPGAPRAASLPVDPGGTVMSIAVAGG
jgi:surface antigen